MNNIAIIPARGGSRRIPHKNTKAFFGKPIIAYSIRTALESGLFEKVYVSTDDEVTASVAQYYGATAIMRHSFYSRDEIGTQEVMQHVLHGLDAQHACCIYATCPMLKSEDLHDGYRALKKRVARFAFSVGTHPLRDAGMFYWGTVKSFIEGHPLISQESVMVPISENRVCDINTIVDWEQAEAMYLALTKVTL